jgi:hypothetical protein
MKRVLVVAVAAIVLTGCDLSKDGAVDSAKGMVASTLKDPDSAKFEGVFMAEKESVGDTSYGYLCGKVNSKNSLGSYTGAKRFTAQMSFSKSGNISIRDVQLEEGRNGQTNEDGSTFFESIYWRKQCSTH